MWRTLHAIRISKPFIRNPYRGIALRCFYACSSAPRVGEDCLAARAARIREQSGQTHQGLGAESQITVPSRLLPETAPFHDDAVHGCADIAGRMWPQQTPAAKPKGPDYHSGRQYQHPTNKARCGRGKVSGVRAKPQLKHSAYQFDLLVTSPGISELHAIRPIPIPKPADYRIWYKNLQERETCNH